MSNPEEFRSYIRHWLEANCPPAMRTPAVRDDDQCWGGKQWRFQSEDQKRWLERMAAKGFTAPIWPREYGGGGLSGAQAGILKRELAAIHARPPLANLGLWNLGPAILAFGSEAQKRRFLPPIARGEIRWCQGYSEPNAGSDLAGLRTRAEDKGDHFLVNGQKIWTSHADKSDAIFCLVRTDCKAEKHKGISFLLFDMALPGVTTKPIKLISGDSSFCETFFDNVKVPKENLLGELNQGWMIAKYLLVHEREALGEALITPMNRQQQVLVRERLGLVEGKLADPFMRVNIARNALVSILFDLTRRRYADEARAGNNLGALSSVLKYYGAEQSKRTLELMMSIGGYNLLKWDNSGDDNHPLTRAWLRSKAFSIEGGTSEIQLNIIAKHLLGLPA